MRYLKNLFISLGSFLVGVLLVKSMIEEESYSSESQEQKGEVSTHTQTAYVFRPLDREEFRRRVSESFPSVYLTVIGIIQAVALGILAENLHLALILPEDTISVFLVILRSISLLLVLIFVFFEYGYFVGIYKWSPGYLDASIPFILGAFEISSAYLISNPLLWWLSMSLLFMCGTLAFCNTKRRLSSEMFSNTSLGDRAFQRVRRGNLSNIFYATTFTLSFFAFATVIYLRQENYLSISGYYINIEILFHSLFLLMIAIFVRKENRFLSDLYDIFSVKFT